MLNLGWCAADFKFGPLHWDSRHKAQQDRHLTASKHNQSFLKSLILYNPAYSSYYFHHTFMKGTGYTMDTENTQCSVYPSLNSQKLPSTYVCLANELKLCNYNHYRYATNSSHWKRFNQSLKNHYKISNCLKYSPFKCDQDLESAGTLASPQVTTGKGAQDSLSELEDTDSF